MKEGERVYQEPNIDFLKSVAKGFGLNVELPPLVQIAQEEQDSGEYVHSNGLEPVESYFLEIITGAPDNLSEDMVIYINDRMGDRLPETLAIKVQRGYLTSMNGYEKAVEELGSLLRNFK